MVHKWPVDTWKDAQLLLSSGKLKLKSNGMKLYYTRLAQIKKEAGNTNAEYILYHLAIPLS